MGWRERMSRGARREIMQTIAHRSQIDESGFMVLGRCMCVRGGRGDMGGRQVDPYNVDFFRLGTILGGL